MNQEEFERLEHAGISVKGLIAIIAMQNDIARSSMGFEAVMQVVVERAMALTAATGSVVEIVDGDVMLYRAVAGSAAAFAGFRVPRGGSLSGLCVHQGVALYAADTATDDRVDRHACQRIGVASMVCVPLFHGVETVGVLKVMSIRSHAFDAASQATVALLADVIASSMYHARAYDAAIALSLHDGLTELFNRRAFDRQLAQEMSRAVRHGRALCVAMFDLDGLKTANDTLGHAAGDAILREAAVVLRGSLRLTDACFRLGGDEFAAILPETTEDAAHYAVARCCANLLAAALGKGAIGVSAGVAELRSGEPLDALIKRADDALYAHKRENRAARTAAGSAPLALPVDAPPE